MDILKELFSSPEGIFSFVIIFIMLCMAGYFINLFIKKMNETSPKK